MRGNNMVAPLAAVAVGGYGRSELAPGSDLDLLFLLPESNHPRGGVSATAACVNAVIAGLWDLGFVLDHAARSPRECLDLSVVAPAGLGKDTVTVGFGWG
jgi:[protein-PII] uridylyltransferase